MRACACARRASRGWPVSGVSHAVHLGPSSVARARAPRHSALRSDRVTYLLLARGTIRRGGYHRASQSAGQTDRPTREGRWEEKLRPINQRARGKEEREESRRTHARYAETTHARRSPDGFPRHFSLLARLDFPSPP